MALRAIQSANTFVTYDDTVYTLIDTYGTPSGHFTIKKISDEVEYCTVYSEGIIRWNLIQIGWITAQGQHLRVALP